MRPLLGGNAVEATSGVVHPPFEDAYRRKEEEMDEEGEVKEIEEESKGAPAGGAAGVNLQVLGSRRQCLRAELDWETPQK